MFLHAFKNTFKVFARQKSMIFWSLIFPLILGVFFKLALGNIDNSNNFEAIKVGVNEDLLKDKTFKSFLDSMEDEDIFKLYKANDQKILSQKNLTAYIEKEDKIVFKSSGIKESIVESIMNSYLRKKSLITNILKKNLHFDIRKIFSDNDYIKDITSKNMKLSNTFFYTLVGMQIMYGYIWGLYIIYQYQANLSVKARRNAISPSKKSISLLGSLSVAFIISFAISLITIFFLENFLGVDFSNKKPALYLLVFIGSFTGVIFGSLIGLSNKANMEIKSGLGVGITMLLSYLAGMMDSDIKIIIQNKLPLINKINPVALITDGIYSLYYYQGYQRYLENIYWLIGVSLTMLILCLFFMKGRYYDSI